METNMIFYGAGNYAKSKLNYLIDLYGEPACFVDSDVHKHNSFIGKYKIVSLLEAIAKYPSSSVAITTDKGFYKEIKNHLLSIGFPEKRLLSYHITNNTNTENCKMRTRYGCPYMQSWVFVHSTHISTCCFSHRPIVSYTNQSLSYSDIDNGLERLNEWRTTNINQLTKGKKTSCFGCQYMQYGNFKDEFEITAIGINGGHAGCSCNLRCIYCNEWESIIKAGIQALSSYEIIMHLADKYKQIRHYLPCNGEMMVLPDRDLLLKFLNTNNWTMKLMTNGVIYNHDAAEITSRPWSSITVSLDAGTRDTYKKIKRVDVFDNVVANLTLYAEAGSHIELKYILLPGINESVNDISEFVDIARQIKPECIALSNDLFDYHIGTKKGKEQAYNDKMTEERFMVFAYFVARIKESGMTPFIVRDRFSAPDYARLSAIIN